ncbi:MAG: DUF2207 domain-containing protein [Chloroflexia bacterium]
MRAILERLRGEEQAADGGAVFRVEGIPAYEGFEVRTSFPLGTVQAAAPRGRPRQTGLTGCGDRCAAQQHHTPLVRRAVLLLGLVGLLVLWFVRGKDPGVGADADMIHEPPSDPAAPLVGVLVDERADVQDVVSALCALERNVIRITQIENDKLVGSTSDYQLDHIKPYNPADLHSYERTLVDTLFAQADSVRLSDVKGRFVASIPAFRDQLYDEVVGAGLFAANPDKVRSRYRSAGVAMVVLGVLGGCVGSAVLSAYANPVAIFLPGVGLAVIGFGLTRLATAMPVRTLNGAVEASRWRSFRNYLAHIERTPDLAQDKEAFERYLSYATAFNIGQSWLQKFSAVGAPAPAWYGQSGGDLDDMFGGRGMRRGRGGIGGPIIIVPPFGRYGGGGRGSARARRGERRKPGRRPLRRHRAVRLRRRQGRARQGQRRIRRPARPGVRRVWRGGWGGGGSGGFGGGSGGGGADFG